MKRSTLTMKSIFQSMMEEGYYPTYENTHIVFGIEDNLAVVEQDEGMISVRLFFGIEEDMYDLFLEAANETMMKTLGVKPVVLSDMKNLMFSCEFLCDSLGEFRKFFPRGIALLQKAIKIHKSEMKKLLVEENLTIKADQPSEDIPLLNDWSGMHKVVS